MTAGGQLGHKGQLSRVRQILREASPLSQGRDFKQYINYHNFELDNHKTDETLKWGIKIAQRMLEMKTLMRKLGGDRG